MPGRVVVVGSLNMDLVLRVPRAPGPGETLAAKSFATACGGKGANQAVACARLGAPVAMAGCVGRDAYGQALLDALTGDGVDVAHVTIDADAPTGTAVILVEESGENRIVIVPGANAAMSPASAAVDAIEGATLLVTQLEIPLDAVTAAVARAANAGVPVLLNAAPANALPPDVLALTDYLVVNESESAMLAGRPVSDPASAAQAAALLRGMGVRRVAVTLGPAGAVLDDGDGAWHLPAVPATAVDTTAAGDTFVGGLAAGLARGMAFAAAAGLGMAAAAVCVTRHGAQPSIPHLAELRPYDITSRRLR